MRTSILCVLFVLLTVVGHSSHAQELPTPAYIYGIKNDGDLLWYRNADFFSGLERWDGPKKVGVGWQNFKQVFSGGGSIIYAIQNDGTLLWYDHKGFSEGNGIDVAGAWEGPKKVGVGWQNFKQVFSGGNSVIYAIQDDGTLLWYRHNGFSKGDGLDVEGAWEGPKKVGIGWQNFKQVFSGGSNIIYAIQDDGTLLWYRHNGFSKGDGIDVAGAWEGPKKVGKGWQNFKQVFSMGYGVIYAIQNDGALLWYRHNGFSSGDGLDVGGAWQGPKQVGNGWQHFKDVFGLFRSANYLR